MPALPATPVGVVKARMQFAVDTDTNLETQFKIGYTGGAPSSGELATIAGHVNSAWEGDLASYLCSTSELSGTYCKDLATPATVEGFSFAGTAGGRGGQIPSLGTSLVVFFRPDRAYRGSRPKMFTPFGAESDTVNGNAWAEDFAAAVQLSFGSFFGALAGVEVGSTTLTTPKSVSYYTGFTVVTSGTTGRARNVPTLRTTPLVVGTLGLEVQRRLGSQRRRLRAT